MNALRAFIARGPVPVFAAVGRHASAQVDDLSLAPGIEMVASPRHASILLVAGEIRPADYEALYRVHDQLPHPRATLWWGTEAPQGIVSPVRLDARDDPQPKLRDLYSELLSRDRATEAHLLPDEPPVPWRGVGEHGQGGKGMMGGAPYGRPMAMTAEDLRDGLALDVYTVTIGPFMPMLPAGLVLELTLQGDVIQRAALVRPPLPAVACAATDVRVPPRSPLQSGALERTRAAQHLRCIARLLMILQLVAQAQRLRRAARSIECGEQVDFASIRRMLRCAGVFQAIPPGLGRLEGQVAEALDDLPPSAAQGRTERSAGAWAPGTYLRHSSRGDHDVRARLHRWLDEAERVLGTPVTAQDEKARNGDAAPAVDRAGREVHTGAPASPIAFRFTDLLPGLEWGEAMLVIASFDVDALCRMSPAPTEAPEESVDEEHGSHHGGSGVGPAPTAPTA